MADLREIPMHICVKQRRRLQETLHNFGVNVTVTNVSCGPTVTRYELQPEMGVKAARSLVFPMISS